MNGQEIIDMFELYLDDTTELSAAEELALLNRIYKKVCRNRPWEFLRAVATGNTSASVPYVSLPADFMFMAENNNSSDNSIQTSGNGVAKVVFVGTARRIYRVINMADRAQYRDRDGFCYVDVVNDRLVFTKQPTAVEAYEFDYIIIPADLAIGDSPIFPVANELIAFGMATDGYIIQIFDKARSYAEENNAKYNEGVLELAYYNANLRAE